MLLSSQDRATFCEWLKNEIVNNRVFIDHCDSMTGGGWEAVSKRLKQKTVACKIVLEMIEDAEIQTLDKTG